MTQRRTVTNDKSYCNKNSLILVNASVQAGLASWSWHLVLVLSDVVLITSLGRPTSNVVYVCRV